MQFDAPSTTEFEDLIDLSYEDGLREIDAFYDGVPNPPSDVTKAATYEVDGATVSTTDAQAIPIIDAASNLGDTPYGGNDDARAVGAINAEADVEVNIADPVVHDEPHYIEFVQNLATETSRDNATSFDLPERPVDQFKDHNQDFGKELKGLHGHDLSAQTQHPYSASHTAELAEQPPQWTQAQPDTSSDRALPRDTILTTSPTRSLQRSSLPEESTNDPEDLALSSPERDHSPGHLANSRLLMTPPTGPAMASENHPTSSMNKSSLIGEMHEEESRLLQLYPRLNTASKLDPNATAELVHSPMDAEPGDSDSEGDPHPLNLETKLRETQDTKEVAVEKSTHLQEASAQPQPISLVQVETKQPAVEAKPQKQFTYQPRALRGRAHQGTDDAILSTSEQDQLVQNTAPQLRKGVRGEAANDEPNATSAMQDEEDTKTKPKIPSKRKQSMASDGAGTDAVQPAAKKAKPGPQRSGPKGKPNSMPSPRDTAAMPKRPPRNSIDKEVKGLLADKLLTRVATGGRKTRAQLEKEAKELPNAGAAAKDRHRKK